MADSEEVEAHAYEMTVDLNVLDHLGINLYSNVAAVLTEAVANAWDADARRVDIRVDPDGKWIEIQDDGIGMSVDDMNEKYLRVGYRRREQDLDTGSVTKLGRPVMGRKGLGKLSLFSIAEEIEIRSLKGGEDPAGCVMKVADIRAAVSTNARYHPVPIDAGDPAPGTKIVLRQIKRQRLGVGIAALRKRLSRRFAVIGEVHDFVVAIDETPISSEDRGDLQKAQFLWTFGTSQLDESATKHVLETAPLPARDAQWDEAWTIDGWIGTARFPKDLDNEDAGNLNGIVVFARGRLIHENVLDRLNDGRLYTKYLTGQIQADFLDLDDRPDIATSDRQRIQEGDARYTKLLAFVKDALNDIEKRWNEWRRKHEVKKAKETSPALTTWLDGLGGGFRESAEKLVAKLSALPLDREEDRIVLYRHGIFAFERMKLRGSTESFAENALDIEALFTILADRDALEASIYRDIVKSRLEAIRAFQKIVDEDAKEKVLQKYLFDHLWLLDAAWERATGSELMESRLRAEGVIVDDLTKKEALSRVDIKYRTTAGKHIIVELKRAGRSMKLLELVEQGTTYVDKLKKILAKQNEGAPNIEVVFVLGKTVAEETSNPERLKHLMDSISPGSRIVHYDTLLAGARASYGEYLQRSGELDRLDKLVNEL